MDKDIYAGVLKKAIRNKGMKGAKAVILNRIAKGDVDLAAAAIVYGIEAKKTPPPTKKKERFTVKLVQLPLVAMILVCVLFTSTAQAVSPFDAMPFHTKAWQQVTQGMDAEGDFIDRNIKEEKMDDDAAHLFFVYMIDDVMTKCRYSLDKTILKIAKEGIAADDLKRMKKQKIDGFLGSCFQLLQKKGLGERAVDLGIFTEGTLNAVRDTGMGK